MMAATAAGNGAASDEVTEIKGWLVKPQEPHTVQLDRRTAAVYGPGGLATYDGEYDSVASGPRFCFSPPDSRVEYLLTVLKKVQFPGDRKQSVKSLKRCIAEALCSADSTTRQGAEHAVDALENTPSAKRHRPNPVASLASLMDMLGVANTVCDGSSL